MRDEYLQAQSVLTELEGLRFFVFSQQWGGLRWIDES
jgi:hypothetical protein